MSLSNDKEIVINSGYHKLKLFIKNANAIIYISNFATCSIASK